MTILSYEDARQQFDGCMVEIEGRLGFVRDVIRSEEGTNLAIKFVGERSNKLIPADAESVFCPTEPYRLGYVQLSENSVAYLNRQPRRQYQVGWSENNVNGFNTSLLLRMGSRLIDNLMGKYVSYAEALEKTKVISGRVAFDRMFAVRDGNVLSYKGTDICRIKDGVPDLSEYGYQHLQGLLDQAMMEK